MSRIGIALMEPTGKQNLDLIVEAERRGVTAAWVTTGALFADALTTFGAVAVMTKSIVFGTAIIPTWPRHPLAIAQQVEAIESIAPGRLRVGLGPSTAAGMRPFGVEHKKPLTNLREYLVVLRTLLHEGSVDFEGEFVKARGRIRPPLPTPVMASALQEKAFELCGEVSDGALTWVCPKSYLDRVALPAMERGAKAGGQDVPPIIVHLPVIIAKDAETARDGIQKQLGAYGKFQFYESMFAASGYPDAGEGFSQALVDDLCVWGSESEVVDKLVERAKATRGELMVQPVAAVEETLSDAAPRVYDAIAKATQKLS